MVERRSPPRGTVAESHKTADLSIEFQPRGLRRVSLKGLSVPPLLSSGLKRQLTSPIAGPYVLAGLGGPANITSPAQMA